MPRVKSRRKLLPPRKKGEPNRWHPELVGKIRGYPKTQEAWQAKSDLMRQQVKLYNAEGITFRSGVPDGWAGKKKLINKINTEALAEAKDIVDELIKLGRFQADNVEAKIALEAAVQVIVAEKHTPETETVPLYNVKDRLAATKIVLEYTQKKPVTKSEVGVTKAEDFLAALATKG